MKEKTRKGDVKFQKRKNKDRILKQEGKFTIQKYKAGEQLRKKIEQKIIIDITEEIF